MAKLVFLCQVTYFLGVLFLFQSCGHVTCRGDLDTKPTSEALKTNPEGAIPPLAPSVAGTNTHGSEQNGDLGLGKVLVYKGDGTLQCGMGEGVSVQVMQKELGNIQIYRSYSGHDGMMRIQLCGSPTGKSNFFEIDRKDLAGAKAAGFLEWTR